VSLLYLDAGEKPDRHEQHGEQPTRQGGEAPAARPAWLGLLILPVLLEVVILWRLVLENRRVGCWLG
jgi:hypothetical protein